MMKDPNMFLSQMRGWTEAVNSVDDRVGIIIKNAIDGYKHPYVHALAGMALTDLCGDDWCVKERDWQAEANALHEIVRLNVRYTLDAVNLDTYRSVPRTLELAFGDCDDIAAVTASTFMAVGYPVRIRVIRAKGMDQFHHVYCVVGLPPDDPKTWLPSDSAEGFRFGEETRNIEESRDFDILDNL